MRCRLPPGRLPGRQRRVGIWSGFRRGQAAGLWGDKIVRPAVARDATRLCFVWILMGCLGGIEVFGLVGLVIGPVLLTLTKELWKQRVGDSALSDVAGATSPVGRSA